MQVNSRNLVALGTTVEQVLDPCTNIRDGATILTADYAEAARTPRRRPAGTAGGAVSAYNTGDFYRGFANGYVARYYGPGGVPALDRRRARGRCDGHSGNACHRHHHPTLTRPIRAVFAREASNVRIE